MSWKKPFDDKFITGHYGTLSEYRKKMGLQAHSGTDWAVKGGTPIKAIANGTITFVGESKVLGHVIVQRAMSKDKKIWYIGYCHLQKPSTLKEGDKVVVGETIVGLVGTTGSASSGNHLHATCSKLPKGVFGVTTDKVDLYKMIEENS